MKREFQISILISESKTQSAKQLINLGKKEYILKTDYLLKFLLIKIKSNKALITLGNLEAETEV